MAGRIPFNGIQLTARKHHRRLLAAFSAVIGSGVFLEGMQKKKFSESLSAYFHRNVALVASGHDALELTLRSLNFGPEDEVIVPVNAYPTAFPVCLAGARLRLADVDENGQLNPVSLKQAVTKRTRAVIMVHLYGLVGDIASVATECKSRGIVLIEDCAQAFGTRYRNKPVGTCGDAACFSFYPTKNLGSLGTGGAVISRSTRLLAYVRDAVSYGEKRRYESRFIAGHSWVSELIWAGLNVYLSAFETDARKRQTVASWYRERMHDIPCLSSHPQSVAVPHLFVIRAKRRDELQKFLDRRGIESRIHYPIPLHLVGAFGFLGYKSGDFPVAEKLSRQIVSLPLHPFMKKSDVAFVVQSIRTFYETRKRS